MFKKYLLVLASAMAVALPLSADEITFTFTGTGSGNVYFAGVPSPFTTFSIVGIGDTDNIQLINGVYSLNLDVSTFQGPADASPFSNVMRVFAQNDVFGFGFDTDSQYDVMAPHSPGFMGYTLDTNLLATSSSDIGLVERFQWIASDGGSVVFDSISSVTASAELSPVSDSQVPEPGSIALFATGLMGLGWIGRRRFAVC